MRLSRRDVAAMRLALECLRLRCDVDAYVAGRMVEGAGDALSHGGYASREVNVAMWTGREPWRLVRARLALLLRATLRAAEGDDGPYRQVCVRAGACDGHDLCWYRYRRHQYTPLWERAEPHTTREGAGRG